MSLSRIAAAPLFVVIATAASAARAEDPAAVPPDRVIGSVYGKPITAGDVGLTTAIDPALKFDAGNKAQWNLMTRIMSAFGGPIGERFVKERKIEVTAEEIKVFQQTMRAINERQVVDAETRLVKLQAALAAPNLSPDARAALEKELSAAAGGLQTARYSLTAGDVPEDLARTFIASWKVERELHWVYGGRVIFQQAGLEALDARRRLYEQAEKNGDLKFEDPGVRHLFYYYSNMPHTEADESDLQKPWFFRAPDPATRP